MSINPVALLRLNDFEVRLNPMVGRSFFLRKLGFFYLLVPSLRELD